jgi:LysM repeat protein
MGQANITNSATASGAGQTSAAATVTVVNLLAPATATPPTPATAQPPSNLTPGATIQHQVAVGEWLIQIGRCYGANFEELRNANPQIANPNFILPAMRITVPRIGSAGRIYGPPCVTFHTVQTGDTIASLAQRYNADQTVLQLVNPGGLVVGKPAKIPLNSAGGSGVVVTTAPPTSVTPAVTAVAPMRITFDPGSTTSSRTGFVNPGQTLQYIVAAQQGQLLSVQLIAPPNEVSLGVSGPTGLALKPTDSNYTWSATVLNTGDHTINLASLTGGSSKSYTLQVSLTTPVPATATPTPTNTPPTPAQ